MNNQDTEQRHKNGQQLRTLQWKQTISASSNLKINALGIIMN